MRRRDAEIDERASEGAKPDDLAEGCAEKEDRKNRRASVCDETGQAGPNLGVTRLRRRDHRKK